MSVRAANLHALLAVAERLEGELEGKTHARKLKANLNAIFIKVTEERISFQAKKKTSWFGRLLEGEKAYSIHDSAKIMHRLFQKIATATRDDLAVALDELHQHHMHENVNDPTAMLLLFKERWNAIMTHVCHKKERVDKLKELKIKWMPFPVGRVRFQEQFEEKVFKKEELLPQQKSDEIKQSLQTKPGRSILKKVQRVDEHVWLKATMPSLKSMERFRKLEPDTIRRIVYKLCQNEMARAARKGAKSVKNQDRAIKTVQAFSKKEREKLAKMAKDKTFVAELKQLEISADAIKAVQKSLAALSIQKLSGHRQSGNL